MAACGIGSFVNNGGSYGRKGDSFLFLSFYPFRLLAFFPFRPKSVTLKRLTHGKTVRLAQ